MNTFTLIFLSIISGQPAEYHELVFQQPGTCEALASTLQIHPSQFEVIGCAATVKVEAEAENPGGVEKPRPELDVKDPTHLASSPAWTRSPLWIERPVQQP